jgi:Predicted membrane protein (DUF2232)
MTQIVLIGLGAGAAAALLFASVTSGVIVSVFLFYLAPLPIMIAALGWSHWAGLMAAVLAAAILGGLFGIFFFGTFLATIGAPAWWLGYLALLGRPAPNGGGEHIEWYPPGRLVLWAAVLGAAVVAAALVTFGGDEATITGGLKDALEHVLRLQTGASPDQPPQFPGIEAEDIDLLIARLVVLLPPVAAMIAAVTQTANLWLAGQVVKLSGRLKRPWPDLTALSFPPLAAATYAAVAAGAFVPDLPGLVARLFAATLTIAFAILGLAVLHATTRNLRGRAIVLSGAYLFIAVQAWPMLIATLVGVAETLFGLRARVPRRGPPAAPKI